MYFITDKNDYAYYNLYFAGSVLNLLFWGLDTIAFRIPAVFYIFEVYILNNALIGRKLFGQRKKTLSSQLVCYALGSATFGPLCPISLTAKPLYRIVLYLELKRNYVRKKSQLDRFS